MSESNIGEQFGLDALLATARADRGKDMGAATEDTPGTAPAHHYAVTPEWMQGRTAYGGLSAALALDAALRTHPGDAPLRTAQIGFVGPVDGDCTVQTHLLRQSKSSRFVRCDVTSALGYGAHALFTFIGARASHIAYSALPAPDVPDPEGLAPLPDHPMRPAFTRKFDMRPVDGSGRIAHGQDRPGALIWVRWIDEPSCNPHTALLALADALPPAAIAMFRQMGPLSSSTWTQHFLTDCPQTRDGWWLISTQSEHVDGGFSDQRMTIWNRDRAPISVGGQGVALYV